MSFEKGLLLLLIVGIAFYFLRRRQHLGQASISPALKDDYSEFWNVLEASIADYKAKMLPYIINQQIIAGHYPQHILPSLETRYGKAGGSRMASPSPESGKGDPLSAFVRGWRC